MNKNINKDSCKTFIQSLLGDINLVDLFKQVREQAGLYIVPRKSYELYQATAQGNFEDKSAGIEYNYNPNPFPAKHILSPFMAARIQVLTIIHEIIHIKTGLDDSQLSRKLYEAGVIKTPPPPTMKEFLAANPNPTSQQIYNWTIASSGYWDSALKDNCFASVEEFKKWWTDINNNP